MTKTEYLTGHKPTHYEAELIPLVLKRVSDMRELSTKLRLSTEDMDKTSEAYHATVKRYGDISTAIGWWTDLIET